ncbi:Protein of unknown function [Paenibacillus sp. UNC496MF]|uniref:DUF3238 domain-containing protein n=1 Tax=Paenibacillus sp. UNC496MF TaxID=1502753 RepID=UPI0008F2AA16|nr:DUF3238 domain-containing protein [Paenibacillus sp. UNC496MF]SFI77292.1 Protein of unknown function [Paenibacillus sp. UNC496MF]
MATIVKIRAGVFVGGVHWLPAVRDPETGLAYEEAGDARESTPHAAHAGRSRAEQEVVVDFAKRKLFRFADTGETIIRETGADGVSVKRQAKPSADGIVAEDESWEAAAVSFTMRASVGNPLRPDAPAAGYAVRVTVRGEDGAVELRGGHDGFPCYEFYKQVDFGEFELLHLHDYREAGTAAPTGGTAVRVERSL